MGSSHEAVCRECGTKFRVDIGASMSALQVRCKDCGRATFVSLEDIYAKEAQDVPGLGADDGSWSIRDRLAGELAATCSCGGHYTVDAPPRCPKCRSADLDIAPPDLMYD